MCRKAKPELLTSRIFSVAWAELCPCTNNGVQRSNNCHTIDGLKKNKLRSGFGIPRARAQGFIALEWCMSVFFITGVPQQIYTRWLSLQRNRDTHSANNWGSAALTGSPATTALIRVRHLAWEWPYRETGAQLCSVLKDALTKCQLFPRNLFIIYSSNQSPLNAALPLLLVT